MKAETLILLFLSQHLYLLHVQLTQNLFFFYSFLRHAYNSTHGALAVSVKCMSS